MADNRFKESNPERGIFIIPNNDYTKENTNRGASITRDPVIPLMEEEKSKAIDRELVIDFNNKIIKAKDPNTGQFVDFNNRTVEQIFNEQGIKLKVLDDIIPMPMQLQPDFKSIDIEDGVIKLHGFDDTENLQIPSIQHGELIWASLDDIAITAGNYGDTESAVAGNNNLFVLGIKKAQVSDALPNTPDFKIVIPTNELTSNYHRLVWKVTTDNDHYKIKFPDNTHFECNPFVYDENTVFDPNTIYIVNLETFDRGKSWFCTCRGFSKLGGE